MAYDEGLAQVFRDALARRDGITEKRMFGGLCFMMHGNMLCGVHKDGGMARVGKDSEAVALQIDGVTPLAFTGRKMGGFVDLDANVIADDVLRARILELAITYVDTLPPK